MATCKKCGNDKPATEMSMWGGARSEICIGCRADMKASRGNGGGSAPAKKAAAVSDKPVPTATETELALEVQAGLGFNAAIDGERLAIVQDEDNVTLSKSEAYVLFAKFAEWAGFKVAA